VFCTTEFKTKHYEKKARKPIKSWKKRNLKFQIAGSQRWRCIQWTYRVLYWSRSFCILCAYVLPYLRINLSILLIRPAMKKKNNIKKLHFTKRTISHFSMKNVTGGTRTSNLCTVYCTPACGTELSCEIECETFDCPEEPTLEENSNCRCL